MGMLDFPVRRYQFTLVAFLCLVAVGVFAFRSIAREEDPSFKLPLFFITTIYQGADPQDLERLVAKPIEDRIAELDNVRRLETTITDGVAFTAVEFKAGSDHDEIYNDVTREINALRPDLPQEIQLLEIRKVGPSLVNTVQFALVSQDAPYNELEHYARTLKDALKQVDGIRTAESWAIPRRELRIELDVERMKELRVTAADVARAVESENANIPGGFVDLGPRSFSLKTSGSYTSASEVADTVVASRKGQLIRIADVATVRWDNEPHRYIGRFNGHRAVFVTANQKDNTNILDVRERLRVALDSYQKTLPKRISLQQGFDQARNVTHRLDRLYTDFSIAIALVLLTLLPLGLRAAGIVMFSIPLSLAFGVAALYFMNYSLNQLSIAGFVVALGLLVDDSIVVVENIARHLRAGGSRIEAALAGTRQIFVAILGCTATLIFAFIPLMALPGNAGTFIRVLPTTVIATIVGSLLISLLIIPFLASRVLAAHEDAKGNALLQRVMNVIHRYYRPALHYCLARPRATVAVAIGGSLLLSALLVPVLGSSLFPKADTPQFQIEVTTPNGSSLAETDAAVRFVESRLKNLPGVRSWFANIGHGNPQIYYNHIVRNDSANYGEFFVQLEEYDTRRTPQQLDELREQLDEYPGARIKVKEFVNGPPITAPIAVRVVGDDLDTIETLAGQVEALLKGTAGTRDVKNPLRSPRTNLRLDVDRDKANRLGVATVEFDRAVRLAVGGIPAGTFKDADGEQYPIMLRTPVGERADLTVLNDVLIPSASGELLPLAQLATLKFEKAPITIQHYARQRSVTIDSEVAKGFNTAKVTAEVVRKLDSMRWPRGYSYVLGGESEAGDEAFGGIGTAIIVAIFGIFAILVLEFGSFKSTLIVLTVVPLGIFGGLLMLLLTGNSISFTATIGFIALIGIEIKNSILLVDFTNQLRERGVALDDAIEQAGEIRFLPILLTSATAIGGLMVLAVQNIGLYSPMAWVIIGGLLSSTLLARLVTPVVYKLIPPAIVPGRGEAADTPAL
ncbi:MAG: efflux RND transporter permease subunit [Steroidobacteraceae bacterium]